MLGVSPKERPGVAFDQSRAGYIRVGDKEVGDIHIVGPQQ